MLEREFPPRLVSADIIEIAGRLELVPSWPPASRDTSVPVDSTHLKRRLNERATRNSDLHEASD